MIRFVLVLAACVCFAVAVLDVVTSANLGPFDGWLAGGLLAWALAVLLVEPLPRAAVPPAPPA
jgi:F0F1-type ATP synthase assembly protein I